MIGALQQQMRTKRNYYLLGILFTITKPEEAEALLSPYSPKPIETNLQLVSVYYTQFCRINNIIPGSFRGSLQKSHLLEVRNLFISSMLKIYCPEVYGQNQKKIIMPIGFVNTIGNELDLTPSNVSRTVRLVIAHEKIYEDFKAKSDSITAELIKATSAG